MINFIKNKKIIKFGLMVLFASLMQSCATVAVKTPVTKTVHLTKPSVPTEVLDVYWAGFAFLGDYSQRATRYPYTNEIINKKKGGRSIIDKSLQSKLNDFSADGFNLHTGTTLGDLESGKGLSMALGISYEDIYVVPFGGKYKASYEIGLNLVVFDFIDKKIITVYPLRFLRNELFNQRPTEEDNKKVIRSLYAGDEFNILQESVNRMNTIVIRSSYGNYIGVRSVKRSNQASEKIPNDLLRNAIIETQIAQEFEGLLSKNSYTPVVPFTKGEAIGRNMRARFSNGKSFDLILPELDYFVDIELRDFEKKSRKNYQGFSSLVTIKASTGLGEVVNIKLSKNGWVLNKMSGNTKNAQWTLYEESLSSLLSDFTKQLAVSTSDWTAKHSITKDANKQMEAFRGLVRKSQKSQ